MHWYTARPRYHRSERFHRCYSDCFPLVSAFQLALAAASSRHAAKAQLRRTSNGGAHTGFLPTRFTAKRRTAERLIALAILSSFQPLRVNAVLQDAWGKGSIDA